mmetsp:Transcript_1589/g.4837  ORF Transcript_1589/g.4837 Transcript_1589/m.4837 type:complete len:340 (+) Transcript_1589:810-1829(+)
MDCGEPLLILASQEVVEPAQVSKLDGPPDVQAAPVARVERVVRQDRRPPQDPRHLRPGHRDAGRKLLGHLRLAPHPGVPEPGEQQEDTLSARLVAEQQLLPRPQAGAQRGRGQGLDALPAGARAEVGGQLGHAGLPGLQQLPLLGRQRLRRQALEAPGQGVRQGQEAAGGAHVVVLRHWRELPAALLLQHPGHGPRQLPPLLVSGSDQVVVVSTVHFQQLHLRSSFGITAPLEEVRQQPRWHVRVLRAGDEQRGHPQRQPAAGRRARVELAPLLRVRVEAKVPLDRIALVRKLRLVARKHVWHGGHRDTEARLHGTAAAGVAAGAAARRQRQLAPGRVA